MSHGEELKVTGVKMVRKVKAKQCDGEMNAARRVDETSYRVNELGSTKTGYMR